MTVVWAMCGACGAECTYAKGRTSCCASSVLRLVPQRLVEPDDRDDREGGSRLDPAKPGTGA